MSRCKSITRKHVAAGAKMRAVGLLVRPGMLTMQDGTEWRHNRVVVLQKRNVAIRLAGAYRERMGNKWGAEDNKFSQGEKSKTGMRV